MSIYAIFSFVAISLKLVLLWANRFSVKSLDFWAFGLFISLFVVNAIEFAFFTFSLSQRSIYVLIVLYHIGALLSGVSITGLVFNLIGRLTRVVQMIVLVGSVVVSGSLIVPGAAIDGVRDIGYIYTRIPGPFYWVFQLFFLGLMLTSCLGMVYGVYKGESLLVKRKSKALLISALPLISVACTIVVIMQAGFEINAVMFASFAAIFLLLGAIATESVILKNVKDSSDGALYRLLSLIPFTREYRLANSVRRLVISGDKPSLERSAKDYEQTIIAEALTACGGNKAAAAGLLGISRTTLLRKLSRSGTKV